jgi:hypothetical protein
LPQLLAWIAKSRAETEPNSPGNCQIWQSGKAQRHLFRVLRQPAKERKLLTFLMSLRGGRTSRQSNLPLPTVFSAKRRLLPWPAGQGRCASEAISCRQESPVNRLFNPLGDCFGQRTPSQRHRLIEVQEQIPSTQMKHNHMNGYSSRGLQSWSSSPFASSRQSAQ